MLLLAHIGYFAAIAALAVLFDVIGSPPRASGFSLGLLVGVTPAFWVLLRDAFGLAHRSMGADAERWTATELARLGPTWTVIHDIELDNLNVDHAVVGPGRVYAVETKWRSSAPNERGLNRLAGQAAHRARKLEAVLRAEGSDVSVTPLLVLWGPRSSDLLPGDGRHVRPSRVTAVAGPNAGRWTRRIEEAGIGQVPVDVLELLRSLVDK